MSEEGYSESRASQPACQHFDAELSAFLEGEDRPAVAGHARECEFCRVVLADLELIRSASRGRPLEEPPARVWANIRATLAAEGIFRDTESVWQLWFPRFGLSRRFAPVGALACLTLFGVLLLVPPGGLERREPGQWAPTGAPEAAAVPFDTGEGKEWARTVREMETHYQRLETFLEPAMKATYQKSLASLNASIHECLDSVRKEPTNTLAREYLVASYARKAEVLTSALVFGAR